MSTEQLLRKHQAELDEVVGQQLPIEVEGFSTDLIPLPHPSDASVWHRTEPGQASSSKPWHGLRRTPPGGRFWCRV
jgi:uracil-DNA glycosylase